MRRPAPRRRRNRPTETKQVGIRLRIDLSLVPFLELYGGLQLLVRCGAICLIAFFVALSDQETCASKQLAAPLPYTLLQSALNELNDTHVTNETHYIRLYDPFHQTEQN